MMNTPECQDPHFQFDLRGPVAMKGKARPMITYLLSRKHLLETDL